MAIATRRSDLFIFKTAAFIRRAINTNVIMVSRNDYFLISAVVVVMVMRDGRADKTNVVMVPRNNHFLVLVSVMVVVMVVVGRTSDVNMVIIPRNNDLLVWPVGMMMVVVASDGMNNILVMR